MSDLHYREKLKNIEKAARTSNEIPEIAKTLGIGCFSLGSILFVIFLLFLAISLFTNDIIIGSIATIIVAIIFLFFLVKFWTAPKFP